MDNAMEFMSNLSGNVYENLKNCMLCKVEKFDGKKMKAELIPLLRAKTKEGKYEEVQMLIEVPVSHLKAGPFIIRPPYKQGDIVVVAFTDADIENILLSGDISNPNSTRKHSLDDAILISGIMPFTKELPDEHLDDLIIAKDDFSSKIVLKEDGSILIESNKGITITGPTKSSTWD